MSGRFLRSEALMGQDALKKLAAARVIVFGAGGVGGAAIETLARGGVGHIAVVDPDEIKIHNLNRQILATESVIGHNKAETAARRIRDINPNAEATAISLFYLPENADEIDLKSYDYIVDAVDTVTAKLTLIERAKAENIPFITVLGTGNRLDPTAFRVGDIRDTALCPLARVMRRELKKRGIEDVPCVYSTEPPLKPMPPIDGEAGEDFDGRTPASVPWCPPVAGILAAAHVIKALSKNIS